LGQEIPYQLRTRWYISAEHVIETAIFSYYNNEMTNWRGRIAKCWERIPALRANGTSFSVEIGWFGCEYSQADCD